MKYVATAISTPLSHVFNLSLKTGIFPDLLKTAIVFPLHKKGDEKLVTNYRPISLTSNIAKTLEKVVKKRLNSFLNKFQTLSKNQYGFREKINTQDAVTNVTNDILEGINKKKKSLLILLDIEKAFDSISHKKLLVKLENIGIRGTPLKWFSSYLSGRKQMVKIGEIYSEILDCLSGLPQGTVLSPLLFLVYVNDLCNAVTEGKIYSFADDTALLISSNNWKDTYALASREISKIYFWLKDNQLKMNIAKTQYITFAPNSAGLPNEHLLIKIHDNPVNIDLCLQNECNSCRELQKVSTVRYLGVYFDQHLKWNKHIEHVSNKIKALAYFFKTISQFATIDLLTKVYYAMVYSIIQYCIIIWGGTANKYLNPLYVGQKYILKIIKRKPMRYPSSLLFEDCQALKLHSIYKLELIKWAFKNKYVNQITNTGHSTRNKSNLILNTTSSKLSLAYKNTYNNSIKAYNELPIEIKQMDREGASQLGLIRKVKIHLLKNQNMQNDNVQAS